SLPELFHSWGFSGSGSATWAVDRGAVGEVPLRAVQSAAQGEGTAVAFAFRCRRGRTMAKASFARPCLNSSCARCTPDAVEGAGAGAAGPFFGRVLTSRGTRRTRPSLPAD